MREPKKIAVVFACGLVLCAASGRAAIITIELTAEVTYMSHPELLDGLISLGDTMTGAYSYDSSTPDSNPLATVGDYWHYSGPYGVTLTAGGFLFQSDPHDTAFLLSVGNNNGDPLVQDNYLFRSYNNLPLYNGVEVDHISWQLDDYTGTALSSDALPLTAPLLGDWPDGSLFRINYGAWGAAVLRAEVTFVQVVPEPGTFLLLALGTLALRTRKTPHS